jgi:hypothetical protein
LTSSVSNAAAIFDRHVSTIDVSAPAGDDIHLVEAPTWDLATSLLLWMVNERAKDDNMMHEMIGWTAFMVWCADADVRRLHRCWQVLAVAVGGFNSRYFSTTPVNQDFFKILVVSTISKPSTKSNAKNVTPKSLLLCIGVIV